MCEENNEEIVETKEEVQEEPESKEEPKLGHGIKPVTLKAPDW